MSRFRYRELIQTRPNRVAAACIPGWLRGTRNGQRYARFAFAFVCKVMLFLVCVVSISCGRNACRSPRVGWPRYIVPSTSCARDAVPCSCLLTIKDLAVDGRGVVTVAGTVLGSYDVDGLSVSASGPRPSAFLLSYAADGKPLWSRVLDSAYTGAISALASESQGDLFAVGSFAAQEVDNAGLEHGRQIVLAKFSPTGTVTWSVRRRRAADWTVGKSNVAVAYLPGSDPDEIGRTTRDDRTYSAIATGLDGSLFVVGNFVQLLPDEQSELQLHARGDRDGFISKYSPEGQHRWTKQIGGKSVWLMPPDGLGWSDDSDGVTQVIAGPRGEAVIAGRLGITGLVGEEREVSDGGRRVFVEAMDSSGNHLWSLRLAPDHHGELGLPKLAGNPIGVTVLTEADDSPDADDFQEIQVGGPLVRQWVRQYDWTGKEKWQYLFSSKNQPWIDSIEQVATAPDGTVVLAAVVHSAVRWAGRMLPAPSRGGKGPRHIALLRLNPEGHPADATILDSSDQDAVTAMRLAESGDLFLVAAKRNPSACSSRASIYKVGR